MEEQFQEQKREYAGFWIRFAAYLLDSIIIGIPATIIILIVFFGAFGATVGFESFTDPAYLEAEMTDQEAFAFLGAYLLSILISILLTVIYFAGMHSSKWQATIGKKLIGLVVTDLKGNRISFWRGLGRYLAMAFLSGIFMIGYIVAAFTEKKQALHDLIAGTLVLKK
ncbi:RDD family protein [Bacillus sp. CGMCC 1.16607]|uniref:RDD family protein n=1 Tax=Bacillus sp. CGMCC 1.16607 TaxID=3351842 RepID=UPI00363D56CF